MKVINVICVIVSLATAAWCYRRDYKALAMLNLAAAMVNVLALAGAL